MTRFRIGLAGCLHHQCGPIRFRYQFDRRIGRPTATHNRLQYVHSRTQTQVETMSDESSTLVVIATYNEIENLPELTDEVFRHAPDVDILVVDDNSPDGTGRWCDERAVVDDRICVIHRAGKLGLGSATIAGMSYAIDHGYTYVLIMDADFSHHPQHIPAMRAGVDREGGESSVDVMIGSRYVKGGRVEGWPFRRRLMSRAINTYARCLLGLAIRDCSGAFRCFRTDVLKRIDFERIHSSGYSFLEEILWHLKRSGARFGETPITFVDRQRGQSKINTREAVAALWAIFRLGVRNWLGL